MPESAQGWRLEIKAYPKLTEKGAWRGGGADGTGKYGGFYTQEQVRRLWGTHTHAPQQTQAFSVSRRPRQISHPLFKL